MGNNGHIKDAQMIQIKSFISEGEAEWARKQVDRPHAHPGSVLVASIGAMYDPGCWQRIVDMVMLTQAKGLKCWMEEILPMKSEADMLVDIGSMRDMAALRASNNGFEWVCFVDSDILPEPDALVKLMETGLPIVVPYIIEPGVGELLGDPKYKKGQGVRPMRWVCASMLLMRTNVFNCPNITFRFNHGDELFFQQLWHFGHRPYMHTDVEVKVTRPPQRAGGKTWDERWKALERNYGRSMDIPDRRPIDPNNPSVVDGVYAPFIRKESNVPV